MGYLDRLDLIRLGTSISERVTPGEIFIEIAHTICGMLLEKTIAGRTPARRAYDLERI
jgi:hypothetical protein